MIVLPSGMSLTEKALEWKKEDFTKAFKDAKHMVDGKMVPRYNPDAIYREVQDYKKAQKAK